MSYEQIATFVILAGMLALFAWDRLRYDMVAIVALLAAVAAGVVEPQNAFRGFSDDIVIIVGSALVVSAAVGRSGITENLIRPLAPYMRTSEIQIVVLCTAVAILSAFMKNIGALAIFIPIAFQIARRTETPVSRLLMPMSFAALLGGMMTLIGTSPNIVTSRMREEMTGAPFGMFDYFPVAAVLTVLGIAFLAFGWRLLPRNEGVARDRERLFVVDTYHSEARLPDGSPFAGKTVRDLEDAGEGQIAVVGIIREKNHRYVPSGHWMLFEGDVLVLQGDAHALDEVVTAAGLELQHDKDLPTEVKEDEGAVMEAVITPTSVLVGNTAEELRLRDRYNLNVLAVSRHGRTSTDPIRRMRFEPGDLVVLRGRADDMIDRMTTLDLLPLAERNLRLGRARRPYLAPAILAVAMILAATETLTVALAFFSAAALIVLFGGLRLKEAYDAIEWPILVLLGALIPVSEALRTTGGSDLIAGWLAMAANHLPPIGALAMVLIAAMAVTPFLNNAATVLLMAPIGAALAQRLGLNADPFLMAVAVGAACDFLTPIGHQCNTLVMGPGGYRFGDYWRLGLPLSILVVVLGTFLISIFWPFG
jgi:di/tricarboxylate transporter